MNKIIIISSEDTQEVIDVIETEKKYQIIGYIDKNNKDKRLSYNWKDKD